LVTGTAGQLGRTLRELATGDPALQCRFADRQALDIRHPEAIGHWLDAYPADVLINAAAYTAVDHAEAEPDMAMAVNATAVGHLAAQCAARGIRLLHVSTDYVFDGRQAAPYIESDTPCPINAYGRSKLAGEALIACLAPDAIILRTSWVFSPYGRNFLTTMVELAREHESLRIVDDQIGGPTCAADIARVLIALAQRTPREAPGGIYHFSGQPHVSWRAFAEAIFSEALACGLISTTPKVVPIPAHEWPTPAQRPRNSRLDNRKLEAVLGPLDNDWRAGVLDALARLRTF
jgi:dTDP-4-dehydrorhamnose reductase